MEGRAESVRGFSRRRRRAAVVSLLALARAVAGDGHVLEPQMSAVLTERRGMQIPIRSAVRSVAVRDSDILHNRVTQRPDVEEVEPDTGVLVGRDVTPPPDQLGMLPELGVESVERGVGVDLIAEVAAVRQAADAKHVATRRSVDRWRPRMQEGRPAPRSPGRYDHERAEALGNEPRMGRENESPSRSWGRV
jgi:hypothetical protein